jgi:hypothetical protein
MSLVDILYFGGCRMAGVPDERLVRAALTP